MEHVLVRDPAVRLVQVHPVGLERVANGARHEERRTPDRVGLGLHELEHVRLMRLRDDEHVAVGRWRDVHERQRQIVLVDALGVGLPRHDRAEDARRIANGRRRHARGNRCSAICTASNAACTETLWPTGTGTRTAVVAMSRSGIERIRLASRSILISSNVETVSSSKTSILATTLYAIVLPNTSPTGSASGSGCASDSSIPWSFSTCSA